MFHICLSFKGSCDFEESLCAWEQRGKEHDDFDWWVGKGKTPSDKTGPNYDHTKKSDQGGCLSTNIVSTVNLSRGGRK